MPKIRPGDAQGLEHETPGRIATFRANDTHAMLDSVCQLIEEVAPAVPRALVAQTINLCVQLRRDPHNPGGRSLTGVDGV
jgi:hypothetical protein